MATKKRSSGRNASKVLATKRKPPKGRIIQDKKVRGLAGRDPNARASNSKDTY